MIGISEPTGPCRRERLEAFEAALGRRLPPEFREHLLRTGGGRLDENVIEFGDRDLGLTYLFAIGPDDRFYDLEANTLMYGPFPDHFVLIGCDDGGNSVLLDLRQGHEGWVWFWDHELEHPDIGESPLFLIDESFRRFLDRLTPLERDG